MAVRKLLKKVFIVEISNKGAPPKNQGPFVKEEYKQVMRMIESIKDPEKRLFAATVYCMQYNLGGRVDDVSKAETMNLSPNKDMAHHNLSIIMKLPWSKNVTTKRQAPWQILIGAANCHYCVLLGIAVYCVARICDYLWLEQR